MKRKIALIIAVCIAFCIPSAAVETNNFSAEAYEKAASLLTSLEIAGEYLEGEFMPYESVTRAEFAEICCRIAFGGSLDFDMGGAGMPSFSDVTQGHWAYSYVEMMRAMGVISEAADRMFSPDEVITQAQAIKMLTCLLGYENQANMLGGYSAGYMLQATKLGLLKGVKIEPDKILSRGQMAIMVYNALFIRICETAVYSNEHSEKLIRNETLMYSVFGIDSTKGVVTAVEGRTLAGGADAASDEIYVDGIAFKSSLENAEQLVGKRVEVYYSRNEERPIVKAVVVLENNVNEIELNNIVSLDRGEIKFNGETKEQRILISRNALWSINNQPLQLPDAGAVAEFCGFNGYDKDDPVQYDTIKKYIGEEMLSGGALPDINGYVETVDNDGDGSADAVSLYLFQNLTVREVRENDRTLLLRDGNGLQKKLTFNAEYDNTYFYSNGQSTTIDSVMKDGVVSVAVGIKPSGESVTYVWISLQSVSGVAERVNAARREIVIDGQSYVATAAAVSNARLREKMKYFMDFRGIVFFADYSDETQERCGYMIATGMTEGLDKKLKMKIFDDTGINSYYCTDKISYGDGTYNDKVRKTSLEMAALLSGKPQLIRFELNYKGEIRMIETATVVSSLRAKNSFTKNHTVEPYTHNYKTRAADRYYIDANTRVFFVPADLAETERYSIGTISDLVQYNVYDKLEVYNVKDYIAQDIVIVIDAEKGVAPSARYAAVGVVSEVEDMGDGGLSVGMYITGKKKDYVIKSPDMLSLDDYTNFGFGGIPARELRKGDILQVSTYGDSIVGFRMLARLDQLPEEYYDVTNARQMPPATVFDALYIGYGEIGDSYKRGFTFNARASQSEEFDRGIVLDNTIYVYKVNMGRDIMIDIATAADITTGDKAIVHMGSTRVYDIFLLDM